MLCTDWIDYIRLTVYNQGKIKWKAGWRVEYMTIQEAAAKWGITPRRIQVLCMDGRLVGATKFGRQWAIPIDTVKPSDERVKSRKYKRSNQARYL